MLFEGIFGVRTGAAADVIEPVPSGIIIQYCWQCRVFNVLYYGYALSSWVYFFRFHIAFREHDLRHNHIMMMGDNPKRILLTKFGYI